MFDDDIELVAQELSRESKGRLHCLPYARTLLDYFEERGTPARPLVARAVVFGAPSGGTWDELLAVASPRRFFEEITAGAGANGSFEIPLPGVGSSPPRQVQCGYRSLGYTHGASQIGSYERDGTWNGHIVVVAENTVIDMTIGQLNDDSLGIHFDPPHVNVEADAGFLSGARLLVGQQAGMMVCYQAFPAETTYEQSRSWSDGPFRNELMAVARRAAGIALRRKMEAGETQ